MEDKERLIPTIHESELATAKQYFYQYFGTPEKISKVFEGTFLFNKSQMNTLNHRITEKLKMHQEAGFLIDVIVKLKNKKILEFNTWNSFMEHDLTDDCPTESVTIKWRFNAILPNFPTPQNHVLSLTLTNGMKPEEMIRLIFSGGLEDEKNLDIAPYPIFASIIFVNNILADELLDIISKWVSAINLEAQSEEKVKKRLFKYRQLIAISTEFLVTVLLMGTSAFFFIKNLTHIKGNEIGKISTEDFIFYLTYFFIVIGLFFIANRIAKIVASSIFTNLSTFRGKSFFELSEKDTTNRKMLQKKKKSSTIKLLGSLLIIIVSSFVGKIIDMLIELF
ncbi:hypothetical protein HB884_07900 [Listeria booriae]|uniref:hypothetical protein n=1 Tax=Listeria booriae TaxID=1552123 RepID=UPI001629E9CB|nr:hypothetical protein [Listeria booriae]MBC1524128.1 hypothetical protein [Listeria booriae]